MSAASRTRKISGAVVYAAAAFDHPNGAVDFASHAGANFSRHNGVAFSSSPSGVTALSVRKISDSVAPRRHVTNGDAEAEAPASASFHRKASGVCFGSGGGSILVEWNCE